MLCSDTNIDAYSSATPHRFILDQKYVIFEKNFRPNTAFLRLKYANSKEKTKKVAKKRKPPGRVLEDFF